MGTGRSRSRPPVGLSKKRLPIEIKASADPARSSRSPVRPPGSCTWMMSASATMMTMTSSSRSDWSRSQGRPPDLDRGRSSSAIPARLPAARRDRPAFARHATGAVRTAAGHRDGSPNSPPGGPVATAGPGPTGWRPGWSGTTTPCRDSECDPFSAARDPRSGLAAFRPSVANRIRVECRSRRTGSRGNWGPRDHEAEDWGVEVRIAAFFGAGPRREVEDRDGAGAPASPGIGPSPIARDRGYPRRPR